MDHRDLTKHTETMSTTDSPGTDLEKTHPFPVQDSIASDYPLETASLGDPANSNSRLCESEDERRSTKSFPDENTGPDPDPDGNSLLQEPPDKTPNPLQCSYPDQHESKPTPDQKSMDRLTQRVNSKMLPTQETPKHGSPFTPRPIRTLSRYESIASESFVDLCLSSKDLDPDKNDNDDDDDSSGLERSSRWQRLRANLEPKSSWILLFLSIMPVGIFFSMNMISFGLYYVEYVEYFGLPRATIGIISTIKTGFISVFGLFTSSIIKRSPVRVVSMVGGALLSLSSLINYFAPNVYVLYMSQGVLEGMACSMLLMNSNVLIQRHFVKNRALGGGLGMLSFSMGHLSGPPLMNLLIETYGWRGSMLIMSAVYANIIAFAATFWAPVVSKSGKQETKTKKSKTKEEETPKDVEKLGVTTTTDEINTATCTSKNTHEGSVEESMKLMVPDQNRVSKDEADKDETWSNKSNTLQSNNATTAASKKENSFVAFIKDLFDLSYLKKACFSLFCLSAGLARYTLKTFLDHGPSKGVSVGLSRSEAASILSIYSMTGLVVRLITTFLTNLRFVNRFFYFAFGALAGMMAALVTLIHTSTGQTTAAAIQGIQVGTTNTIQVVILVDLMGTDRLAKSLALYNLIVCAISMLAPPVGGYIYDISDNYDIPFLVSASTACVGFVIVLCLGIPVERDRCRRRRMRNETTPSTSGADDSIKSYPAEDGTTKTPDNKMLY